MKALFLRYLPLLIAAVIFAGGLFAGHTAQAAIVETVRELTPDSAQQQLTQWLGVLTYAATAIGALGSLLIAQFFKLRSEVRNQGKQIEQHDEVITKQVVGKNPTPTEPAPPPALTPPAQL